MLQTIAGIVGIKGKGDAAKVGTTIASEVVSIVGDAAIFVVIPATGSTLEGYMSRAP